MVKIGYVRVSREDQHPENQIGLLINNGVPKDLIFVDKLSGITKKEDRSGFSTMIAHIKTIPEDEEIILYVFEISRIGRSFLDTLNTVTQLEAHGLLFWSLSPSESWSRIEDKKLRDLMLSIFSWCADRERENLIERTKLGLARAKSEGKKLGRPERKLPLSKIKELRDKKISLSAISRIIDVPYSTLRRNYTDEKQP